MMTSHVDSFLERKILCFEGALLFQRIQLCQKAVGHFGPKGGVTLRIVPVSILFQPFQHGCVFRMRAQGDVHGQSAEPLHGTAVFPAQRYGQAGVAQKAVTERVESQTAVHGTAVEPPCRLVCVLKIEGSAAGRVPRGRERVDRKAPLYNGRVLPIHLIYGKGRKGVAVRVDKALVGLLQEKQISLSEVDPGLGGESLQKAAPPQ